MASSVDILNARIQYALFNKLNSVSNVSNDDIATIDTTSSSEGDSSFEDLLMKAMNNSSQYSSQKIYNYPGKAIINTSSSTASMANNMQVSDNLISFIAEKEGFSATPYRGVDYQNLTVGYGHVLQPGESFTYLSQDDALEFLKKDLGRYINSVKKEFGDVNLNQNQFDALISFTYNLGANIWHKSPEFVNHIKQGASADVLREDFASYCHCNGAVVDGLLKRRIEEWEMFVS